MTVNFVKVIIFAILSIKVVAGIRYGDARISNVKTCEGNNYTMTADLFVKNHSDGNSFKATIYMKEEFGNDNKYSCRVYTRIPTGLKQVININGKHTCSSLNKLAGKFWWDIQEGFGMKPGKCPIEKKTWNIDWVRINYGDLPLVAFVPDGKYKVDCKLFDAAGKLVKACLYFDAIKMS